VHVNSHFRNGGAVCYMLVCSQPERLRIYVQKVIWGHVTWESL